MVFFAAGSTFQYSYDSICIAIHTNSIRFCPLRICIVDECLEFCQGQMSIIRPIWTRKQTQNQHVFFLPCLQQTISIENHVWNQLGCEVQGLGQPGAGTEYALGIVQCTSWNTNNPRNIFIYIYNIIYNVYNIQYIIIYIYDYRISIYHNLSFDLTRVGDSWWNPSMSHIRSVDEYFKDVLWTHRVQDRVPGLGRARRRNRTQKKVSVFP